MSLPENTLAEANRKYFDAQGDSVFDQEWIKSIARRITDFLQSNVAWSGLQPKSVIEGSAFPVTPASMLDYACGNGVISRALYPYVSQVRGIDVSGGMVEKYNQAARLEGLSKQQMYAIQGDLSSPAAHPELQGEDFFAFHVIVMSMALHHIENPQELLTRLVERLRDGGAVIIIDWASNDAKPSQQPAGKGSHNVTHDHGDHSNQHGDHPASHTVAHAGFSEDQMQKMLSEAGCSEVDYVLHPEMSRVPPEFGGPKHLFFARGKKGTPQTS